MNRQVSVLTERRRNINSLRANSLLAISFSKSVETTLQTEKTFSQMFQELRSYRSNLLNTLDQEKEDFESKSANHTLHTRCLTLTFLSSKF
jgi:hypothetical protein